MASSESWKKATPSISPKRRWVQLARGRKKAKILWTHGQQQTEISDVHFPNHPQIIQQNQTINHHHTKLSLDHATTLTELTERGEVMRGVAMEVL